MTTLATAGNTLSTDTLQKVDIYVNCAVAGQVQVYLDGTKIIDYSGDVTTNSATALASAVFGQDHANGSSFADYWSEIIVSTTDTRSLSLVTLLPAAAGNTFNWTGATSDVNEVTLDDATLITSATAGEIAQTTVSTTGVGGTAGIVALVVNAGAQKGGTGPQNADLTVRTGGGRLRVGGHCLASVARSHQQEAWREARHTAWQTFVKVLTTGLLAALLVGAAIKLKVLGGGQ